MTRTHVLSQDVQEIALKGDTDRAQALAFLDEAVSAERDSLRRVRLRWVRGYVKDLDSAITRRMLS